MDPYLQSQLDLFYNTLNAKEKNVSIKTKKYNTSNFKITKDGKQVNDVLCNAILTYYHHSKVKVTNNGSEIFLHGSFKDSSKNPVPIYFNINNEIYKMESKN